METEREKDDQWNRGREFNFKNPERLQKKLGNERASHAGCPMQLRILRGMNLPVVVGLD